MLARLTLINLQVLVLMPMTHSCDKFWLSRMRKRLLDISFQRNPGSIMHRLELFWATSLDPMENS